VRAALVVARFYEDLAERLVAGARAVLDEAGITEIDEFDVPGAFELPMAAKLVAGTGRYVGIVCLGAVIRGETDHYDYVCGEAARGIQDVQLTTGVPCTFGVLTVDTREQALARSGGDKRDSGRHAAEAVVALLEIKERLAEGAHPPPGGATTEPQGTPAGR
jgi:6,7-dimethyl-8-ribityllumazine synthase